MWTLVYISQKVEEALNVKSVLESEGIIAKNKRVRNDENDEYCFEILVPSSEVKKAHDLIIDIEF